MRRVWIGLVAALVFVLLATGSAAALDVARLEDRIVDPAAHARITYENTVNVASYQQHGILTHKGYQYTAWYQNTGPTAGSATAVIARRALPDGPWESTRVGYTLWSNNSHNTISLGVTPSDGRLHVAFPTHDQEVRYTRTVPGVLDHPKLVRWSSRLFDSIDNKFPGAPVSPPTFTYPQFLNAGGRTLVTWRSGSTDNGRQLLLRYNDDAAGTWTVLGRFSHNAGGVYDGGFGTSSSRYGYIHGFSANPVNGDIAITMSWREQSNAWCEGPLAVGNHDLGYAVSSDGGMTWRNNNGSLVAATTLGDTSLTITPFSPGIVVVPIGINKGLINQETQAFDSAGHLHVVTSRVPDEDVVGNCVGDFYVDRAAKATPYHHWRDADGTWHTLQLPFRNGTSGRTKLAFDGDDNAYVVLPDGRIVAASAASRWTDWELVFAAADVNAVSELIIDSTRLRQDGVLTVAYQEPPSNPSLCRASTSSTACTSAFRLASFALGSGAPDAPRATVSEAAPAAWAGFSHDPAPDLGLELSAAGPFVRGSQGSYEVKVANVGTAVATQTITVRDTLPAGVALATSGGAGWSCTTNGPDVECKTDADIPTGGTAPVLRLDVTMSVTGDSVANAASVTTPDDFRPANNVATIETAVVAPQPEPEPTPTPTPAPTPTPTPTLTPQLPRGSPGPLPSPPGAPSLSVPKLPAKGATLARLLGRGVVVRGRCSEVASGTVGLTVAPRLARTLRSGRMLARAAVTCRDGRFTARLRAKAGVKRALRRHGRTLPAKLTVRMSGASGAVRATAQVRLRA